MTTMRNTFVALFAAGLLLVGSISAAQSQDWWPIKVFDLGELSSEEFDGLEELPELVDYIPLETASQKWHICVLFPHMKDSYWVAVNYGVMDEARRLGIKATLFSAGGYTELNKQISAVRRLHGARPGCHRDRRHLGRRNEGEDRRGPARGGSR